MIGASGRPTAAPTRTISACRSSSTAAASSRASTTDAGHAGRHRADAGRHLRHHPAARAGHGPAVRSQIEDTRLHRRACSPSSAAFRRDASRPTATSRRMAGRPRAARAVGNIMKGLRTARRARASRHCRRRQARRLRRQRSDEARAARRRRHRRPKCTDQVAGYRWHGSARATARQPRRS